MACLTSHHNEARWVEGKPNGKHAMKPLRNRSCPNYKHSKINGLTHFFPTYFRLGRVVGSKKILCFYILITYNLTYLTYIYKITHNTRIRACTHTLVYVFSKGCPVGPEWVKYLFSLYIFVPSGWDAPNLLVWFPGILGVETAYSTC